MNHDITGTLAATLKPLTVAATGTAVPAIDGVATVQGVQATISAGDVEAIGYVRQQTNEWCEETHTKAVAWCLYLFRDEPRMSAKQICEWLDEIGAKSPHAAEAEKAGKILHNTLSWERYYLANGPKIEKMVSVQRKNLRKRKVPVNH